MALSRTDPNYFGQAVVANSTSTEEVDFGFPATHVRVLNTCNGDAYMRPDGNTPSSQDMRIAACSEVILNVQMSLRALRFYSTSTGCLVNVTALGGGGYGV
jgi:hypothetical protein